MRESKAAQNISEAFSAAGVSSEQAEKGAQEFAEAVKKTLPRSKLPKRIVDRCDCAICHRSNITLLKREGAYVCRPCYQKLLTLRTLEKQQQKERAEI